jgi:dTMP kinase
VFVTFEGPEGSGKSTAMRAVAKELRAQGREVVETREPGGGKTGAAVREILLHGEDISRLTETFLFLADRSNNVKSIIKPALESGAVVLCDRHADSTVVYQGHARGMDLDTLRSLNSTATDGLKPDLTILIDLSPEVGLARIESKDRLDAEPIEFHQMVRQGFLDEAAREPGRWHIISGDQEPEEVAAECLKAVTDRL